MKFSSWLEKKDKPLYESILSEMDRRQFLGSALGAMAGLGTIAGAEGKAETPKTRELTASPEATKPITASLENFPKQGKFVITIKNSKGKGTHQIQSLIKTYIEKFLHKRELEAESGKDPYVNIDFFAFLTNKEQDDVHGKFNVITDLLLSPIGRSSNKLEAFLLNNKDAYDKDGSLTFVFKYSEKRPQAANAGFKGQRNPAQAPIKK